MPAVRGGAPWRGGHPRPGSEPRVADSWPPSASFLQLRALPGVRVSDKHLHTARSTDSTPLTSLSALRHPAFDDSDVGCTGATGLRPTTSSASRHSLNTPPSPVARWSRSIRTCGSRRRLSSAAPPQEMEPPDSPGRFSCYLRSRPLLHRRATFSEPRILGSTDRSVGRYVRVGRVGVRRG